MKTSRLALGVIAVSIAIVLLGGFLYFQRDIAGLINHSDAAPMVSPSPSPTPSPNYATSSTKNSTTATYDGTTLVCTWSLGVNNPYDPLVLYNGSNAVIYFKSVTVTNIGDATAYVSGIRVQTYAANGTQLMDHTIPASISINIFLPNPPVTLSSGNSFGVGFSLTALQQNPNVNDLGSDTFATYTITPVWTNTPLN